MMTAMSTRTNRHGAHTGLRIAAFALALAAGGVVAGGWDGPGQPGGSGGETARPSAGWDERAAAFSPYRWISRPSRDAVMGFTMSIDIIEIPVKAGQRVKTGDLLVRGRDGEALAGLVVARTRAENTHEVDSARANMELAEIRFNAGKEAFDKQGMSPAEFEERRLSLAAAKAAYEATVTRVREQRELLVQSERQFERFGLRAPFDGIVDQVVVDVGSNVNEQQPVLRLVQIDPLWIDVPVAPEEPIDRGLKEGSPAWVLIDAPGETRARQARVLYVAPVIDAGGTLRVRVEVPNPRGLPAGSRVAVRFTPPPGGEAALVTPALGEGSGAK